MKPAWDTSIDFVLRYEGELFENDPRDPGGETKFGISKKSYPNLDISALTREKAADIYRRDFWEACHCDSLPRTLAIMLFDCAVNQGTETAVRILQRALDVPVDGVMGPLTIGAASCASPRRMKRFTVMRLSSYASLMSKRPELLVFAENWFFRVLSVADVAEDRTL